MGEFTIPEGFSGNRRTDTKNAMQYLSDNFNINKIPKGYVVHHGMEDGLFQLIREDIHDLFKHYGGNYYYGGR